MITFVTCICGFQLKSLPLLSSQPVDIYLHGAILMSRIAWERNTRTNGAHPASQCNASRVSWEYTARIIAFTPKHI